MALFLPPQQYNQELTNNYFEYSESGLLDVLGADFEQVMYENPMSALGRTIQLYFNKGTGKKLSADEYKDSFYYREGLEVPEDGIHESEASILAERYDLRARRQNVQNRYSGGVFGGASRFGVTLVGSMLDPLNVGVSFVPVFGQARYANMAAKHGRTTARLAKGGVEGFVGATLVEPLVYGAAKYEQDMSYTIADSLLNVTIGSALGAGLQAGGGALADAIRGTSRVNQEQFIRTAVGQLAEGQKVDVEPMMLADPNLRESVDSLGPTAPPREGFEQTPAQRTRRVVNKKTGEVTEVAVGLPESLRVLNNPPETLIQFMRRNGGVWAQDENIGDIIQIFDKDRSLVNKERGAVQPKPGQKRISKKKLAGGKTLDEMTELLQEAGFYTERPTITKLLEDIEAEKRQGRKKYSQADADKVAELEAAQARMNELDELGIDPTGRTDDEINFMIEYDRSLQGDSDLVPPDVPDGLTEQEFFNLQQRLNEEPPAYPEFDDFKQQMDEMNRIDSDFEAETRGIDNEIEMLEKNLESVPEGVIPDDFMEEIRAARELEEKAKSYESAALAGADCLMGRL
jgi:hypothetical protein